MLASTTPLTDTDRLHLTRCVELATQALAAGDDPFGAVLVDADGAVLAEERNRESTGDATRHPELDLARWAGQHLEPGERRGTTVYTSGEHCAMCSAAHALVGLGRIVYACSSTQLAEWRSAWGSRPSPVVTLSVNEVAPGITIAGPDPDLVPRLRDLHEQAHHRASRHG